MNVARSRKEHKPYLRWTRLLASAQLLQLARVCVVELAGEAAGAAPRRAAPAEAPPTNAADETFATSMPEACFKRRVARHEDDVLAPPVLGREPLEHARRRSARIAPRAARG